MNRNTIKEHLRLMAYRKLKLACCRDGGFKAKLSLSDLEKINALLDERNRLLMTIKELSIAKNKALKALRKVFPSEYETNTDRTVQLFCRTVIKELEEVK